MEVLGPLDPRNDDSLRFSFVSSKDSWRLLEALGSLDLENYDSFMFSKVFDKDSWRFLDPWTLKVIPVSHF